MHSYATAASSPARPMRPPAGKPTAARKPRRYKLSDAFFKDAIDQAVMDSLFSPVSLNERHDVKLKPQFETACWAHLPPHRIYIGLDLFEKEQVKLGLTTQLQQKYIHNHYHHELAHALYTIRDLKEPKAALAVMRAPFSLWNLFEDAYIEDRYRREAEYRFEWRTMEDVGFSARPESLLFGLIQAEGDVKLVQDDLNAWRYEPAKAGGVPDGPVALDSTGWRKSANVKDALLTWMPKVVKFYERTIKVTGSMQLMPIIKAWIDEFGLPPSPPPGGPGSGGAGTSDLELAEQLAGDPAALEEFEQGTKDVSDKREKGKGGKELADPSNTADKPISKKGEVLQGRSEPLDTERIGRLAARFRKFFEEVSRRVSTLTPQRRISARHFAIGRAPYRKEVLQGRGKKNIVVVVDCSGSMSGTHMEEGLLLVAALSELARAGAVSGHVIFSGVDGGPIHETYALPMKNETISRADACFGGEGLEPAIRCNIELCRKADYVFVYTDANITDTGINKAVLHAQGIFTWGLYAGSNKGYLDKMLKYFDKAILRDNADELVDAMLAQNK
ncbi:hypothetical protein D3C71_22210 [compost metagenome]